MGTRGSGQGVAVTLAWQGWVLPPSCLVWVGCSSGHSLPHRALVLNPQCRPPEPGSKKPPHDGSPAWSDVAPLPCERSASCNVPVAQGSLTGEREAQQMVAL